MRPFPNNYPLCHCKGVQLTNLFLMIVRIGVLYIDILSRSETSGHGIPPNRNFIYLITDINSVESQRNVAWFLLTIYIHKRALFTIQRHVIHSCLYLIDPLPRLWALPYNYHICQIRQRLSGRNRSLLSQRQSLGTLTRMTFSLQTDVDCVGPQ